MFLLTVKKKFVKELTVIGIILTALVAVVYHLFIPCHSDILLSFRPLLHRNVRVQLPSGYREDCNDLSGVQGAEIHPERTGADILRICD